MIGIIVAMQKELDLLLDTISGCSVQEAEGYKYYCGSIDGAEVVAMTCGIGKVNAALGAAALIRRFEPSVVINSGVAGGTGAGAKILDVVLAERIAYHDVWCGPGTQWGEAAGCPTFFAPKSDPKALAKAIGTKCGLVASGDIFVSRVEEVQRILALYPEAVAVDMESAAIAQVCFFKGVDMYCLRVISDTPGAADNISQYEHFWSDAPRSSFCALKQLISLLK